MGFTVMLHHKLEGINSACVTLMETRESGASTSHQFCSVLANKSVQTFSFLPDKRHIRFPSVSANNDFYRLELSGRSLVYILCCLSFLALKPVMLYGRMCLMYTAEAWMDISAILYGIKTLGPVSNLKRYRDKPKNKKSNFQPVTTKFLSQHDNRHWQIFIRPSQLANVNSV